MSCTSSGYSGGLLTSGLNVSKTLSLDNESITSLMVNVCNQSTCPEVEGTPLPPAPLINSSLPADEFWASSNWHPSGNFGAGYNYTVTKGRRLTTLISGVTKLKSGSSGVAGKRIVDTSVKGSISPEKMPVPTVLKGLPLFNGLFAPGKLDNRNYALSLHITKDLSCTNLTLDGGEVVP